MISKKKKDPILFMKFNNKLETIFLDLNSLDLHPKKINKKVNVILSPSLYWVKKISLPVKYVRDAIKLLPSVFEEILPAGNYSYSAYKDGDEFFVFAYEDKLIIDTLLRVGVNFSNVANIYFAQSEMQHIRVALKIDEVQSLYVKDGIVVLLPCCWIEEAGELKVDEFKLSKHSIKLRQFGHIVDNKSLYKIGAILACIFVLLLVEYFIVKAQVDKIENLKTKVFVKYNLKSTMFQNKSMLKKYKNIHTRQTKIREYISYILSFNLKQKEKLSKITLKQDSIKIEFINSSNSTLSRIENILKSKKLKFKIDLQNNKIALEMML